MARRAQLVCQYFENVSRKVLEEHQGIVREYIRGRPGIYALFRKGKLYYVGLARNLRSRLRAHLNDKHGQSWDRFSVYLTIGDAHMKELESLVLRIMRPTGNSQKGKFAKADNLQRRLRREIAQTARRQIYAYFSADSRPPEPESRDDERTGRRPALAPYIKRPLRLRRVYKGKTYKAKVRANGVIRFQGKNYNSPSQAGSALLSGKACDGWIFWRYERAPGDWVPLDKLRNP